MVKAQEYLNQHYPCDCSEESKKQWPYHEENCPRNNTKELNLRNLNLEGDLDLEGFPRNLNVYVSGNPNLGEIKNEPAYATLVHQNPQEWLNHQYSNKNQVEKIDLGWLGFEQPGELTIDSYPNFKEINWGLKDNITKITITNCPKLEKIDISKFKNKQKFFQINLINS